MTIQTNRSPQDIEKWFKRELFSKLNTKGRQENITTYWLGQPIYYKLSQPDGYITFWKEAYGGALIVFNISQKGQNLSYDGYCPVLVFGFWKLKISFKKNALAIMKYRAEGYELKCKFENYLSHNQSS